MPPAVVELTSAGSVELARKGCWLMKTSTCMRGRGERIVTRRPGAWPSPVGTRVRVPSFPFLPYSCDCPTLSAAGATSVASGERGAWKVERYEFVGQRAT